MQEESTNDRGGGKKGLTTSDLSWQGGCSKKHTYWKGASNLGTNVILDYKRPNVKAPGSDLLTIKDMPKVEKKKNSGAGMTRGRKLTEGEETQGVTKTGYQR